MDKELMDEDILQKTNDILERVKLLQDEISTLQHKFLRLCGWEWSCNTPGSYWLWKKHWYGAGIVCVDIDKAITMQVASDISPYMDNEERPSCDTGKLNV